MKNNHNPYADPQSTLPLPTLEDRLREVALAQRTVFVDGDIEEPLAKRVSLEIESLRLQGTDPIRLIVNSRGGDVSYGAQIIAASS